MRKVKRNRDEERWLSALGKHIYSIIKSKGYDSPYDFWIHAAGDSISRANLDYVLKGEVDVKATTIKKIADALEVDQKEILNFKVR